MKIRVKVGKLGWLPSKAGHTVRPQHRFYRIWKFWIDIKWGELARARNLADQKRKKRSVSSIG
jgi:hypothetical protein